MLQLALFLLALCGGTWLCAKAPPLARTVALAAVTVLTLLVATSTPEPTVTVGAAVVLAAVTAVVVICTDWRYQLSKIVPMPMASTWFDTGRHLQTRDTWVQWRDHVMRHRQHALTG